MPTTYALKGVNFDEQEFSPSSDCALWRRTVSDGILQGLAISASGSGIRLTAGWIMAGGKELQLPSTLTIPATGATSGFARLVVNVDLTRSSTEQSFLQGWISIEYASSRSGFAALAQDDLAGTGSIYQMVLCVVSLGATGVTGVVWTCGAVYAHHTGLQLTLSASGWANNQQTVDCDGVLADPDRCHVFYSFAPTSAANREAYQSAGIWLSAQGDGTLTFTCDAAPDADVAVVIYLG